eukprot:COSAG02_NODE_3903_length_6061_cov_2.511238_2_plen_126_part_00
MDELAQIHKCADTLGRKAIAVVQKTADLFRPTMNNTLAIVQHALVLFCPWCAADSAGQVPACSGFLLKIGGVGLDGGGREMELSPVGHYRRIHLEAYNRGVLRALLCAFFESALATPTLLGANLP